MPELLIAAGHDIPLEDLAPFIVPPQTPGMIPTRRSYAASGRVIDELLYVPYTWPLFETEEDLQAQLDQLGLLTATTAPVSVYVEDGRYNWVVRNGTAVAPQIGTDGQRSEMFLQNFVVIVKDLRPQP